MKLIDNVVAPESLIQTAKDWIIAGGKPQAPWDAQGFKLPGVPIRLSMRMGKNPFEGRKAKQR